MKFQENRIRVATVTRGIQHSNGLRKNFCLHSIDEETEAQMGYRTCAQSLRRKSELYFTSFDCK